MRVADLRPFDAPSAARFQAAGLWRDEVLTDWLERHARLRPDAVALCLGDVSITWAGLHERVRRLAGGLRDLGLGQGDVVAVQLPNTPEFVVAFLAITALGGVMQTIHMPYRAAEYETLLRHAKAKAFICLGRFKDETPAATALALRLPDLRHVIALGPPVAGTTSFADLAGQAPMASLPALKGEDPFVLLYTSGTTSSPKGVPHRYQCFMANARVSVAEFQLTERDVILCVAPFSHLYGLFSLHLALCAGATSLLLPAFAPGDFAALVESGRATALFTAPTHCAAVLQAGLFDKHDFGSVRFAVISGSLCPPDLAAAIDAKLPHGEVQQLWGMSELQAGSYTRPGMAATARRTTIGPASPGTELRVVDAEGRPLPANTEGELQVRGCSVFSGYLDNDGANEAAFAENGWFRTGDLAILDNDNCLVITGRLKDVINRGGVKFNPADIEAAINRMPGVAMSAIVPMPDPVLGERAACFIQAQPGATAPTLPAICAHLDTLGIAKNKWPEHVETVTAFPLTPTNKIIKGALRPTRR